MMKRSKVGLIASMAAMMGIGSRKSEADVAPRVEEVRLPKAGKLSRWLGEVRPGHWRSIWKGSDPYRYCSGAREASRRRKRIMAGLTPAAQVLGPYYEAEALAMRLEYPHTHRFAA